MTEVFIHFNQSKCLLVPNTQIFTIVLSHFSDQHLIHDVKGKIVNLTHRKKTLKKK